MASTRGGIRLSSPPLKIPRHHVKNFIGLELIRAITGHDPEGAPTLKWTFLLPFNWGYAEWTK